MDRALLKQFLDRERIDPSSYSIDGTIPEERYCLRYENSMWRVFYSERGLRTGERLFADESAACEYLLELLVRDAPRR